VEKVHPNWVLTCFLVLSACTGEGPGSEGGESGVGGEGGAGSGAGPGAIAAPEAIDCGFPVPLGPECAAIWLAIVPCCADTNISSSVAESLICSMNAGGVACGSPGGLVDAQCAVLDRMPECHGAAGAGMGRAGTDGAGMGGAGMGGAGVDGAGVGGAGVGGAGVGGESGGGEAGGFAGVGGDGTGGGAGTVVPPVDPVQGAAECEAVCGPCDPSFRAPGTPVCCGTRTCSCDGIGAWFSTVDCADRRMVCEHRDTTAQIWAYCAER